MIRPTIGGICLFLSKRFAGAIMIVAQLRVNDKNDYWEGSLSGGSPKNN